MTSSIIGLPPRAVGKIYRDPGFRCGSRPSGRLRPFVRSRVALSGRGCEGSERAGESMPLLSTAMMFGPAYLCSNLAMATPAAPAPTMAILQSLSSRPVSLQAFISPARVTVAVPCWSSCITGIFSSAFRRSSISKHFGAAKSSRFIPPKLGAMALTALGSLGATATTADAQTRGGHGGSWHGGGGSWHGGGGSWHGGGGSFPGWRCGRRRRGALAAGLLGDGSASRDHKGRKTGRDQSFHACTLSAGRGEIMADSPYRTVSAAQ